VPACPVELDQSDRSSSGLRPRPRPSDEPAFNDNALWPSLGTSRGSSSLVVAYTIVDGSSHNKCFDCETGGKFHHNFSTGYLSRISRIPSMVFGEFPSARLFT